MAIQFSLDNMFALAYWQKNWCIGSLYQDAAWDCYFDIWEQGQGHLLTRAFSASYQ
jgi:hypothetical protein